MMDAQQLIDIVDRLHQVGRTRPICWLYDPHQPQVFACGQAGDDRWPLAGNLQQPLERGVIDLYGEGFHTATAGFRLGAGADSP